MSGETSLRDNRRYSADDDRVRRDSVSSSASGRSSRRNSGSRGSNVSNEYKVAAMDQMRRMSETAN
jgi:shikimate 5-dehydrogenase